MEAWLARLDALGQRRAQALGAAILVDGAAPWIAALGIGAACVRLMLSGSARVVGGEREAAREVEPAPEPTEERPPDWLPAAWGEAPRPVRVGDVPPPDALRAAERPALVWLPSGAFWMGSREDDERAFPDERPRFRCRVPDLAVAATPVTRLQWAAVMEEARGDGPEDGPVNHVTRLDAVRFCNRWSELDGLTPCYAVGGAVVREPPDGDGYRLPTEAEWAYACRAGTDSAWSFGDDEGAIDDHAWSERNGGRRTHPVAERRPNPWGLYDLHGNVWEWRGDAPVSHPNTGEEEVQDPFKVEVLDVQGNSWRCARGGSASSRPRETRSSHRGRAFPEDMGFRCVWVSAREHSG